MGIKNLLKTSPLPHPLPPPGRPGSPLPISILGTTKLSDELLRKGLKYSAIVHGSLLVASLISTVVFHKKPVQYQPSIRVDIVGLPDVKKSDLADVSKELAEVDKKIKEEEAAMKLAEKAKAEKAKKKEAPDPADMALKKKEKDRKENLKSAIDRIKALSDIEAEMTKAKQAPVKGNALSKGNSLTGAIGQDRDAYLGSLLGKLKQNWNLPVWLARQNLNAKVMIFIDRIGAVKTTMFVKDSGSQQFNDYVLRTIKASEPFGMPPDDLIDSGITLGFPL